MHEEYARCFGIDTTELLRHAEVREFGDCSGQFDAGGTGPHDHEGQQLLPLKFILCCFRQFERGEESTPDLRRILHAL